MLIYLPQATGTIVSAAQRYLVPSVKGMLMSQFVSGVLLLSLLLIRFLTHAPSLEYTRH
jgi:hypothetical protein